MSGSPGGLAAARVALDPGQLGTGMRAWIGPPYPWLRSITGAGTRRTLEAIGEVVPLQRHEAPNRTPAFDWEVPRESSCRTAWAKGPDRRRVVDPHQSSLHVLDYRTPFRGHVSRAELVAHVQSLPDRPDWIPHRTSCLREAWDFCMRHRDVLAIEEVEYELCIDASLEPVE